VANWKYQHKIRCAA